MRKTERRARKAALEAAIEQQRLDLLIEAERWHAAARPLAAGLCAARCYRVPALGAGSLLLWWTARHPGGAMRLGRRALFALLTARRLQRWLPRC